MPTINDIHQDAILTNISLRYKNVGYVADAILPRVPVKKSSDKYYIYDKQSFNIDESRRAARSKYNRIDWSVSTDTYSCDEHGLEQAIDDKEKRNADKPLNLEIDTAEIVTDKIMLNREKRVADLVFSASTITENTTLSGTDQWSDAVNSDPIGDIDTGIDTVIQNCGKKPNLIVINRDVFIQLKEHPAILDKIKYSQKGIITPELLAAVFNVEQLLVADTLYNSAAEGQTVSLSRVWGKKCLIAYREMRPSIKKISLGYTFESLSRRTEKYRERSINSDVIRVREEVDEKIVATACAYLIVDAVA